MFVYHCTRDVSTRCVTVSPLFTAITSIWRSNTNTDMNPSDNSILEAGEKKLQNYHKAPRKEYLDIIMLLEFSVAKVLFNKKPEMEGKENDLTYTETLIGNVRRDLVELASELGRNEWQSGIALASVDIPRLDSLFQDVGRDCSSLEKRPGHDEALVKDCKALQEIWNNHRKTIEDGCQAAAESEHRDLAGEQPEPAIGDPSSNFTPLELKTVVTILHYEESLRSYVGSMARKLSHWIAREADSDKELSRARSDLEAELIRGYEDLEPSNRNIWSDITELEQALRDKLGSFIEVATASGISAQSAADSENRNFHATVDSESVLSIVQSSGSKRNLPDRTKKRKLEDEPSRGALGRRVVMKRM